MRRMSDKLGRCRRYRFRRRCASDADAGGRTSGEREASSRKRNEYARRYAALNAKSVHANRFQGGGVIPSLAPPINGQAVSAMPPSMRLRPPSLNGALC
jgi:hypothetical protein